MSLSLSTFHQRVSRAINRGKVFDGDIPAAAKDAVRTLENLNNWRHMWVESFSQTLTAGTNTISLTNVKSVRYIRIHSLLSDGSLNRYKYLKKVSADQVISIDEDTVPTGFWMLDQDTVEMDGKPSEDLTYDIGYYQYSDYDNNLPWLEVSEGLLIAQTMIEISPLLKDDRNLKRWVDQKAEKLGVLEEADLVHEFDGQEQRMTPYADEIDDWMLTGAGTD